jgi:hypothetical protein
MVEGGYYVYQEKVYKCTRTGLFKGSYKTYKSPLCCSDTVFCGDDIRCGMIIDNDEYLEFGGSRIAEYEVINLIEEGVPIHGLTESFISTRTDYDSLTHQKLGDYLRFLHSQYGLNLMPLYNCFSEYYVQGVDLTSGRLIETNVDGYRTTLVPIKFNRQYTVAMNSDFPVYMMPVLYDGKLIRRAENTNKFLCEDGSNVITKVGAFRYKQPVVIDVSNTNKELQPYEKNLYLAIQFPKTVNTPITVIEGDFSANNGIHIYDECMFKKSSDKFINNIFVSNLSLLNMPTGIGKNVNSVPFSDKLVAYLLRHTIDMRSELSEDVEYVTNAFGYSYGFEGSWEPELRGKLFDGYMLLKDTRNELNYNDILGYVDRDIENALSHGWLKYNSSKKLNKINSVVV